MRYAVEKGLDAVRYIPAHIGIGLDIQKLIWEMQVQKHRSEGDLLGLLLLFPDEESSLRK
jgi:hypothetical protein